MTTENIALSKIPDDKPVRVFLPIRESKERFRANGVYQHRDGLQFRLDFKPGILPEDAIDIGRNAIITVDLGGANLSLEAIVKSVPSSQHIILQAASTIDHEQLREFFRVDATTRVLSTSFHSTVTGGTEESWEVEGDTIDISGSGMLAVFPKEIPNAKKITLKVTLPHTAEETISILAHTVRSQQLENGKWEIAYHFDDIEAEDRDKIIGYCLTIQRRLLRLKVQVRS